MQHNITLDDDSDCHQVAQSRLNRGAFAPLFQRYYARVFAYAAARLGDERDAQDITAETFRRAIAGLSEFTCHHEGSFAAWLFRIAYNEVMRHYERSKVRRVVALDDLPDLHSDAPDVETELYRKQQFAHIRQLIERLSPRRQEIIALRFYGEMRNNEIALVLGLDERTVASHLCRALDELHALLQHTSQDGA